jgi:transposase
MAEAAIAQVNTLAARLEALEHQLGTEKRNRYGRRSERLTDIVKEATESVVDFEAVQAKRRERAERKNKLETVTTFHPVKDEQKKCPHCQSTKFKSVGEGKVSEVLEYVPAKIIVHKHVREVVACECHGYLVTAEGPEKVTEKGQYGASFVGHVVTRKCADATPLYRLSKEFARAGFDIPRSTLTALFHQAADALQPLVVRLLDLVRHAPVVNADETTVKVQQAEVCRTGYMWTFRADSLISYVFAPSRSGETPEKILGGTSGALVVDGYSGYNKVTAVEGRLRVGCWAHVRRKFYDALEQSPEAKDAIHIILGLYRVEHEAKALNIVRTPQHQALRLEKSPPILNEFKGWLESQSGAILPKSPLGTAIGYALNQWDTLQHFVKNVNLPLDNNAAERALRQVALGRKNFLFVGHDEAGENLAGLYSLAATCEANGVNPEAYFADVLLRLDSQPQKQIDELLPNLWKPPSAQILPPNVFLPLR